MQLDDLRHIGLTEGEIRVYKALLELGECTKTSLGKTSGVSPSNIYDITNRLLEKGLVSKVEKDGVSHFSPANPKRILDFLEGKHHEIEKEKELVQSMLPLLLSTFQKTKERVNVEVFQGWKGMATVFKDLLEECSAKDRCAVFGASRGEDTPRADRFFLKYSQLRAQKGITTWIIFNKEMRNCRQRIEFFLTSKKYKVRFLPQITATEIMIYKNRTCILILVSDPIAIRITNQEVSHSFKQYFDVLWKEARA